MPSPPTDDRSGDETLDYAERWLRDGLSVLRPAFSVAQVTVDMTRANARLDAMRRHGVQATSTHLLVHAAARALAAHPHLHQIVAGIWRHRPRRIDIGLSVTGDTFVTPVLVIEDADRKSIEEIAEETRIRAPEVLDSDRRTLRLLRRWGRLVPFGFMRRALLRALFSSAAFRRKGAGSFQVSTVPADWALSSAFSTAGVLIGGQTRSRVVAVDGRPVVRPVMTLTLSGDHGVWNGQAAVRFLAAVKSELESTRLDCPASRSA
jgi:pyruvate dehydrogenase E2 component (dihydrolipoamide acetyltransferase)